jgi:hypothetical protein
MGRSCSFTSVLQLHLGLTRSQDGAARRRTDSFDDGPSGLAAPLAGPLAPTAVGGLAVATRISIAGFHSGGAGVRDPRHIHPDAEVVGAVLGVLEEGDLVLTEPVGGEIHLWRRHELEQAAAAPREAQRELLAHVENRRGLRRQRLRQPGHPREAPAVRGERPVGEERLGRADPDRHERHREQRVRAVGAVRGEGEGRGVRDAALAADRVVGVRRAGAVGTRVVDVGGGAGASAGRQITVEGMAHVALARDGAVRRWAPRPVQRTGDVHDEGQPAVLDADGVQGGGGVLAEAGQ